MGGQCRYGLFDVHEVRGVHDRQAGHPAHDGQVLGRLMAGIVAGGQAGQGTDDVDVELRLSDVKAQEVIGAPRGEDRVGGGERRQTHLGQPRGRAQHHLFRHAHLEEAVGVSLAEDVHVGVLGQVRGEADHVGAFGGEPGQCMSEGGFGGALALLGDRGDHRGGGELALGSRGLLRGLLSRRGGVHRTSPSPLVIAGVEPERSR
jgi:hypothetical protein